MASQQQQGHFPYLVNDLPPSVDQIRKKRINEQQTRATLGREVTMLEKMLNQEEKVHEILEQVHSQQDGSSISIPSFLPPKMKELLAELAMVEGEIARLERQIGELQLNLKHEQEITKEAKSKQLQSGGTMSNFEAMSGADQNPMFSKQQEQATEKNVTFESKTLHFISKAIKGDYTLSDFSVNEKMGNPKTAFDQKESQFQVEVRFQETPLKKSGMFKPPPSPVREFTRHPSPMPKSRGRMDNPMDLPLRTTPSSIHWEEISPNLQPNKLSENIMKCLSFIYVRLLRTSRAMELEKSGAVSRSMKSSLSSRSFRVEHGASSLVLQKESRQQDPFGIFDMEESIPRDIGPYKNLVVFTSSSMDPKCISSSSSIPLLKKLRVLMDNLQVVDLRPLNHQHKLAFWINMYNACIMHGYLQFGVPDSPENFLELLNKAALNVGGNVVTARAIEHYILRRPAATPSKIEKGEEDKETIIHELYGLESTNPNVTFALCCGTRSSPAVKIYTADGVVMELEKSKLEYLQASIVVKNSKKIVFPELLLRNMTDFALDINSLVQWVCHQLPTSESLRKSLVDCFRSHNGGKLSVTVEKMPYDFEFQYLLPI